MSTLIKAVAIVMLVCWWALIDWPEYRRRCNQAAANGDEQPEF